METSQCQPPLRQQPPQQPQQLVAARQPQLPARSSRRRGAKPNLTRKQRSACVRCLLHTKRQRPSWPSADRTRPLERCWPPATSVTPPRPIRTARETKRRTRTGGERTICPTRHLKAHGDMREDPPAVRAQAPAPRAPPSPRRCLGRSPGAVSQRAPRALLRGRRSSNVPAASRLLRRLWQPAAPGPEESRSTAATGDHRSPARHNASGQPADGLLATRSATSATTRSGGGSWESAFVRALQEQRHRKRASLIPGVN